jgi:GT2 family glycosyltransferase
VKVTALLVSHNGARWLPAVLSGLAASTRKIDAIVAVDTGSIDESVAIVERATGAPVIGLDPRTPYAESIRVALESAAPAEPDEWIWLLHDDSNPAPECLETLVEAASAAGRDVAVLGPKLREWPSLKRLLEVGVTLTGTGQRETGLERGEYDQGQHDEPHRVLAVNTAGMLVRRDVLAAVGFDQYLPVFGTDIDFGWRVARAGYATRVIPAAVMFHLEASRQGRRDSELVEHPGRQIREGAQYTLLVNSPGWTIPFRSARMILGGLLRAIGLLLVRAPSEAADEVAALLDVFSHPRRIAQARRGRAAGAKVPHEAVKPLLAPFWLPYRHGMDYVTDVGIAVADSLREQAERRRPEGVTDETPWFARFVRAPAPWALLLAVIAGHSFLSGGPLHGGALLPVPDGVGHWWSAWASSQHDIGTGSSEPGPAYLFPLAALGTLFFGHVELVLDLVFIFAVPAAFLGALRFLRKLSAGTWVTLWGAATFALMPVVSGAVSQGRIGTVVGAAVLPYLVTAALGLAASVPSESGHPPEVRRWRSAWRTSLLAGLLISFVPSALIVLALVLLFAVVGGLLQLRSRELVVLLVVPVLLVLPWAIGSLGIPGAWLVEAGRAAALPANPTFIDLLLGRTGGIIEAPAWIGIGLPIAALVAFIRPDTRVRVLQAWAVVLAGATVLAATSRVPVVLPGVPVDFRPWPGFLLILIQGGFIVAAAIAADGAVRLISEASFTWRQPVAAVTCAVALLAPVFAGAWWVVRVGDGPLQRSQTNELPVYIKELARGTDKVGVLRITGSQEDGIEYQVLRSGPLRLGDDGVLALTKPDPQFRALVGRLLSTAKPSDSALLASYGVKFVYAPRPVAGVISGGLDAATGFSPGSEPAPGSRTWIVQQPSTLVRVAHDSSWTRPLWVLIDVLTLLVALVLAAPDRKKRS